MRAADLEEIMRALKENAGQPTMSEVAYLTRRSASTIRLYAADRHDVSYCTVAGALRVGP